MPLAIPGLGMNSKILCRWLDIVDWPPDHYVLLGLKPGEADAMHIEQRVQERMTKLRCYQLSHPEEATEGMNRVAQAFICLTEALAQPSRLSQGINGSVSQDTFAGAVDTQHFEIPGTKTGVDWKNTPPPVRVLTDFGKAQEVTLPTALDQAAGANAESPASVPVPIDPITQLAHLSPEARRGLGTLPALVERVHQTRRLVLAWNKAGRYLSNPTKKLIRSVDEADLTRRLNKVFELTADFPKIVGHPGQPGYRVVAMARLEMTAQMFKMLDKTQRLDLARDWEAGQRVLLSHRRFLLTQFKLLRSRGPLSLALQAIRGAINDYPVWVLAGLFLAVLACVLLYQKLS
jgi:hypothetical protein